MKRFLLLTLFIAAGIYAFGQTDGISYQAVILDPNGKELPGVDAEGNILPNANISIRFTIIDANNTEEYQEIQNANTDAYGMINLMIGQADPDAFAQISWDGTNKDLRVEIDFTGAGSDFVDLSRQQLTFVPFAYHRNITAHGNLVVDDAAVLNSQLTVEGPTNLNSSLDVNNNNTTNLTGPLNVEGTSNLNNDLIVAGPTNLDDSLSVNNLSPTYLSGNLTVGADGRSTFNGPTAFNAPSEFVEIAVQGPSNLNGQVRIDAHMDSIGYQDTIDHYGLIVMGSDQGIAIKVNGNRDISNNYISFWDEDNNQMWGRIEGETIGDLWANPEHIIETVNKSVDIAIATAEFLMAGFEVVQAGVELTARGTATTLCAGFGACVTVPPPSMIVSGGTNLVLKIANAVTSGVNLALTTSELIEYEIFKNTQIGVTYQSGSGDYAEWLPKKNPDETFKPGDIVGVTNGYITKSTSGADKVMVISTKPIVLGNMPPENQESNYEKIAFMGQVPVKVFGNVVPGDYILPTVIGSGFGQAVNPENMSIADYKKIVGVAWSEAKGEGIGVVNVAVGLNTNDISNVVLQQDKKIKSLESELSSLQQQMNQTTTVLNQLVPGFEEANKENSDLTSAKAVVAPDNTEMGSIQSDLIAEQNSPVNSDNKGKYYAPEADEVVYFEVSEEQLEESISRAKEIYLESSGKSLEDHPFWKKMETEPAYVEEVKQLMKTKLEEGINTQISINKKFENKPMMAK